MIDAGPLRFLVVFFAGWVNRQQRDVIEYGSSWNAHL
jgi:hypothetical protein